MTYYIGVDLGTSAVKLLLCDEKGKIINSLSKEYPLYFPKPGWSEQNPEDWWEAVSTGLQQLCQGIDKNLIKGIGCGGQMHGLVILDEADRVIRPAILWNDGRTEKEVAYLNEVVGKEKLSGLTANIAFAGFTAPKLLWLKNQEPENFAKIAKIMLPKDYINYRLTGVHSCDYSDASGMLLLDVEHKCWSKEMLDLCQVQEAQLPKLYESYQVIGTVKEIDFLPDTIQVVAGAGDNAAAAIGTGTLGNGNCNISIGTSGTIFISSDHFCVDSNNALHAFAHGDGRYHLMGCMLSAASCNKWFCDSILQEKDYDSLQKHIREENLGKNQVLFLPYLMGERSPINDSNATGTFIGMSLNTTRYDMLQAVLEGVAFALRDSLEIAKALGIPITVSKLCGGGAKSALWSRILANVLNLTLQLPKAEEGPGYGGMMLAMVGCGQYETVQACAKDLVGVEKEIHPEPALVQAYEKQYQKFKMLYPALKGCFSSFKQD